MTRSVLHRSFTIDRTYDADPARVFRAHSEIALKRQWFAEGEGWHIDEYTLDFRVGGQEFCRFRFGDGPEMTNLIVYQDIVPDERLVAVYTMTIGDKRISSSLATTEFKLAGRGTKLIYTEQTAFLDGIDKPEGREEGCRELFGVLGEFLKRSA